MRAIAMQLSPTFHASISPQGRALRARCEELLLEKMIALFASGTLTPKQSADLTRAYCKLKKVDAAHDRNQARLAAAGIKPHQSRARQEAVIVRKQSPNEFGEIANRATASSSAEQAQPRNKRSEPRSVTAVRPRATPINREAPNRPPPNRATASTNAARAPFPETQPREPDLDRAAPAQHGPSCPTPCKIARVPLSSRALPGAGIIARERGTVRCTQRTISGIAIDWCVEYNAPYGFFRELYHNVLIDTLPVMPEYSRAFQPGGTFSFTRVTAQRRPILVTDEARGAVPARVALFERRAVCSERAGTAGTARPSRHHSSHTLNRKLIISPSCTT
jgi:hypothetical protein